MLHIHASHADNFARLLKAMKSDGFVTKPIITYSVSYNRDADLMVATINERYINGSDRITLYTKFFDVKELPNIQGVYIDLSDDRSAKNTRETLKDMFHSELVRNATVSSPIQVFDHSEHAAFNRMMNALKNETALNFQPTQDMFVRKFANLNGFSKYIDRLIKKVQSYK